MSDSDLLAVLVGSGHPTRRERECAEQLLREAKSLAGLSTWAEKAAHWSPTAHVLGAALELARRTLLADPPRGPFMDKPARLAHYLFLRYNLPGQEILGAAFLDCRGRLIGDSEVFRGALRCTIAEPAPVFREAIRHCAGSLALFHTHPSGDPTPSSLDLAVSRRFRDAGSLLGIPVVDHMILGSAVRFTSLRDLSPSDWGTG